ncbi:hypothetical protein Ancab_033698 [Ancistrocladus abbreviatus]
MIDNNSSCCNNVGDRKTDSHAQAGCQLPQQHPQTRKHKKQVRQRLHTSWPYQDRLLNMAEARREIVAAVKFCRAKAEATTAISSSPPQERLMNNSPREDGVGDYSRIHSFSSSPNYMTLDKYFPYSSNDNYNNRNSYNSPASNEYQFPWPNLPNQNLGLNLNLNFQDFCNFKTYNLNFYHKGDLPSPSIFCSSSSSSASPPLSHSTTYTDGGGGGGGGGCCEGGDGGDLDLQLVPDDKDMTEIRSIGEQHQIEWDDTLNLSTSPWWFNFFHAMDMESGAEYQEHNGQNPLEQAFKFPAAWLSAKSENLLEDDSCISSSEDYLQDPDLLW